MLTKTVEMEMKKLHMGTMSYGFDSMDEVAHQLHLAFGASAEQGMICSYHVYLQKLIFLQLIWDSHRWPREHNWRRVVGGTCLLAYAMSC